MVGKGKQLISNCMRMAMKDNFLIVIITSLFLFCINILVIYTGDYNLIVFQNYCSALIENQNSVIIALIIAIITLIMTMFSSIMILLKEQILGIKFHDVLECYIDCHDDYIMNMLKSNIAIVFFSTIAFFFKLSILAVTVFSLSIFLICLAIYTVILYFEMNKEGKRNDIILNNLEIVGNHKRMWLIDNLVDIREEIYIQRITEIETFFIYLYEKGTEHTDILKFIFENYYTKNIQGKNYRKYNDFLTIVEKFIEIDLQADRQLIFWYYFLNPFLKAEDTVGRHYLNDICYLLSKQPTLYIKIITMIYYYVFLAVFNKSENCDILDNNMKILELWDDVEPSYLDVCYDVLKMETKKSGLNFNFSKKNLKSFFNKEESYIKNISNVQHYRNILYENSTDKKGK